MNADEFDFLFNISEEALTNDLKEESELKNKRKEETKQQYSQKYQNCFNNSPEGEEAKKLFYEAIRKRKRDKAHENRKRARREAATKKWTAPGATAQKIIEQERLERQADRDWLKSCKEDGLKIVFDLSFEGSMFEKEVNSLAFQICHSYSAVRKCKEKMSLNVCSYVGNIREITEKIGGKYWFINKFEEPFETVFKDRLADIVYLSPDGEETLSTFDPKKIYIIGGLVDNTIIKNQSRNRAKEAGVISQKLPLELLEVKGKWRHSLNVNTIVEIIGKYLETKDMKIALEEGLPSKYKKYSQKLLQEKNKVNANEAKNDSINELFE